MKTLILPFVLALAGCVSIANEYGVIHHAPAARIVTALPEGGTKVWEIYEHPREDGSILVVDNGLSTRIKTMFFVPTAPAEQFTAAARKYLAKDRPTCSIASMEEFKNINAYRFRLSCM